MRVGTDGLTGEASVVFFSAFSSSVGDAMYVPELTEPPGEYAAFSSTSLMEMFVDSLSEKLSIEPRRSVPCGWMNVGIVTLPKPEPDAADVKPVDAVPRSNVVMPTRFATDESASL